MMYYQKITITGKVNRVEQTEAGLVLDVMSARKKVGENFNNLRFLVNVKGQLTPEVQIGECLVITRGRLLATETGHPIVRIEGASSWTAFDCMVSAEDILRVNGEVELGSTYDVVGRLIDDPKFFTNSTGLQGCSFPVLSYYQKSTPNERCIVGVSVMGEQAEALYGLLSKGSVVYADGQLMSYGIYGGPKMWGSDVPKRKAGYEMRALVVRLMGDFQ